MAGEFTDMSPEQLAQFVRNHNVSRDKLEEIHKLLTAAAEHRQFNKILFVTPNTKQRQFMSQGAEFRERLFEAGNQTGKTYAGAIEAGYHATGDYPQWWTGRRFDHPVRGWLAGETALATRDIAQKYLCGEPGIVSSHGTGFIPRSRFVGDPSRARGVTDAYDTIFVEHRTNGVMDGVSRISFKSYEQGRSKLQGDTIDFFWCDEEPEDQTLYNEILARLTASGMGYMTFTPLLGRTPLWERMHSSPFVGITHMELMDKETRPDMTEQQKIDREQGYEEHEREARSRGEPLLGEGKVFHGITEEQIKILPFQVPLHFVKGWGIDFGIGHPFGAVLMAWDRDTDVLYVIDAFKQANTLILQDAARMKSIAIEAPVAWPQDGWERDKQVGEPAAMLYKKEGLMMMPSHATFESGSRSTEEGILEMAQRMKNGKLKVFSHLVEWFEEFRYYHRKDGKIVKIRDDIMSATRVGVMAKRFFKPVAIGSKKSQNKYPRAPRDGDDLFE